MAAYGLAFSSLRLHSARYVIKDVELADLKRMVRTVYRGHAVIDPKIAPQLISAAVNGRAAGAGFS